MPENWKTYKIGDITSRIYSGGTPSTTKKEFWNGSIPWLSSGETRKRYIADTEKTITSLGFEKSSARMAVKGSTVIASAGQGKTRGQTSYLKLDTSINQSVICIESDPNFVDGRFLFFNLSNRYDEFRRISDAFSIRGSLTIDLIKTQILVNLPPLQEQESIASILSALDDKIELNLQMNTTLEEMAMALYKHWFIDFGPFQDGEFVDSELGEIPKGWEVKLLDEVVDLIIDHRGKTPKKLGGDWSNSSENCIEAISAKNIKAGKIVKPETIKYITRDLFSKWMKDPLQNKDILLTSEAPIGEYYFILNQTNYCLSQRLFGIRSNPHILRPELLYCFLTSSTGQNQLFSRGSGSTVQGIKQSELRKLNIIVPTKEDQNQISEKLLSLYEQMRNNDEENQTLTQLRDTLLPKLISGEVRVKDVEKTLSEVL